MPSASRRPVRRRPRGSGGSRRSGGTDSANNQGMIDVAPVTRRSLRFTGTVSSVSSAIVTRASLLSMLVASPGYAPATTSVVLVPIFEAVRVRRLTITIPGLAATAAEPVNSLTLEWFSFLGRNIRLTKTETSVMGATFTSVPPRGSRAAMWSSASTSANALTSIEEVLFVISHTPDVASLSVTVPLLVTIEFDAVVSGDTLSLVTLTTTVASQTNPGVFALPLDLFNPSNALGSARLSPVGYPDARIDSNNASIAVTAAVRTN